MKHFPHLFSEGKLGKRTVKNRIAMSPMGDNMANADGSISEQSLAYYTERAKGGAGIIVVGVVSVDYPRGKTIPCQHRLDEIKYVKDWERLARNVHRYGALLIPQIHHAGAATDRATTEGLTPYRVSDEMDQTTQVGSKVDEGSFTPEEYQTLTNAEIKELEQKFINTAIYAQMAGCDGVELHGISYLICQFFTKFINHRTDEYGGSLENRCRFAVNIIKGVREACGEDFIIGIRMPVHKWETDGFTDEDSIWMAQAFEKAGADFIDANGGIPPTITCLLETQRYEQGDRVHLAKLIKENVNIPVFAVGNLREPDFCEDVLASGAADFVMLGRPLLADPYWPEKAQSGRANEIRRCISCLDACYGNLAKLQSIRCVINPTVGYESELKTEPPAKESKKIVIVGGGLAGMQAAITANERGHDVTILEASDQLGGQMHIASKPLHKDNVQWAIDWFTEEIERQSIKVELNKKADIDVIKAYNPDLVFVATGSEPWVPDIEGIEHGVSSWDILSGDVDMPNGKNIVVIGGGTVGCETAVLLSDKGNDVTVLEMLDQIATGMEMANKLDLRSEMQECGIKTLLNAKVVKISPDKVEYVTDGEKYSVDTDYIVLSLGQCSIGTDLVQDLKNEGIPYTVIGDAVVPGKFVHATTSGFFAALNA